MNKYSRICRAVMIITRRICFLDIKNYFYAITTGWYFAALKIDF